MTKDIELSSLLDDDDGESVPLSRNLEDSPLSLNNCQESHAAPFKKVFIQRILLPMFGLVCIALPNFVAFKVKSTTTLSSYTTLQPIIHSNTTYGHIHMAKTGGTTLNGILALNYERVCGHKGYSYDYVQANKRFKNSENWRSVSDSLTQKKLYNRGRVPVDIMEEIGYEDCDWISQEGNWDFWLENFLASSMELHLPCRDPLDHLMSQCNFWHKTFNCDATNLEHEIKKCVVFLNRFSLKLAGMTKCYDYNLQFTSYMKLMSQTLLSRKITDKYVHRSTNDPRNKTKECIWYASEEFRQKVNAIMISNYDYYSFCDRKVCVSMVLSYFVLFN